MITKHDPPSYLSALDQIKAIALEGLRFTKDPYDIDRYNKLIKMVAHKYSEVLAIEPSVTLEKLRAEIGVVTPKLGAEAAVLNGKDQLLILRRSDDGSWCLPCGWVDVAESPAQASVRETREETGLIVTPLSYIFISCKGPSISTHLQHQVNIITLMTPVALDAPITLSHEHTDFRWIDRILGGIEWHPGHQQQVQRVFDFLKTGKKQALPI